MTAYELACEIINRADNVQACKYQPRGNEANAVCLFMGRAAGHEVFISKAQAELFVKLLAGKPVITNGIGDDRFAGFVKTIFSAAKNKEYYLLTFCGHVQAKAEEVAPEVVDCTQANDFAAKLIAGFVEKGWAKKDDRAAAGEDYLCCWTTKAQADALLAQLPAAVNAQGRIITQACGSFCYWTKVRAASGAMLLCWMGEVTTAPAAAPVKAEPVAPAGKLIPLDMDIPF